MSLQNRHWLKKKIGDIYVLNVYEHTIVAGLPGDNNGVRFGAWLRYKLNRHIIWCLDIVPTDFGVFLSKQRITWPWNTT